MTAATLTALAVSGVQIAGAIGDSADSAQAAADLKTSDSFSVTGRVLRAQVESAAERRLLSLAAARASRARLTRDPAAVDARRRERAAAERARNRWVLPLVGYRLTAGYGDSGTLWASTHTGQDFAAPEGTPVRAIADGRVVFAGWDGSYGLKVVVEHPDGTVTWYAHLSSILRTSGHVSGGEVIARVGSTGNSTGDHLHLEVRPGGGPPVPPLTWLRERRVHV